MGSSVAGATLYQAAPATPDGSMFRPRRHLAYTCGGRRQRRSDAPSCGYRRPSGGRPREAQMQSDAGSPRGRSSSVERRLATILMAAVFGYSRMMGEDEERTVQTLRGHREVFDELLGAHKGRVFNTAGDAILAEFPSAVEAVRCATEIQTALRTRNE